MTAVTVNGFEIFTWAILARVNPNAHNPRYGRDCRSGPVVVGTIMACSAQEAEREAEEEGLTYNPEMGEYHYVLDRAVKLPTI